MLDQLKTDLSSLVKGYIKFAQRFTNYRGWISLLLWYAGSSFEEKLGSRPFLFYFLAPISQSLAADRCDPLALNNLTSERLSPYALPFESAFIVIHRRLQRMTKFWKELEEGLGSLPS
jgi:hypothetical protein